MITSFLKVLLGMGIGYVLLVLGTWAFQERLIFFPDGTPAWQVDDERMALASFETDAGDTMQSLYAPANVGCPTMVFFHGNASHISKDIYRYRRVMDAGVGLLAVSWPGYAGSDGKPGEASFHAAAKGAMEWLTARGIETKSIVVHGNSIGTGPATFLATQYDVGALVLEAPYFSIEDLVAKRIPYLPSKWLLRVRFHSDEWIANVAAPVLIAHGTADSVIPISQSKRLFELASAPKTYYEIPNGEHSTLVRDGLYEDGVWPFLSEVYPECDFGQSADEAQT